MGDLRRAASGLGDAHSAIRRRGEDAGGSSGLRVSGPIPRWLYAKLGRHYPGFVLALEFSVAHIVVFGGMLLLTLYIPMSLGQFIQVTLVAELLVAIENIFATRVAAKLLRPVNDWLAGRRDRESTVRAWETLAALPAQFMRRWGWVTLVFTIPPIAVYTALALELPGYAIPILMLAGLGVLVYGGMLRFFAIELVLRPVLEDISRELPQDVAIGRGGFPLKWKLMAALPMINIITGVVVAELSRQGPGRLTDLGIDVAVAVAVAGTISLEVYLLMSRSILTPLLNLRQATERLAGGDLSARVAVISTDETGELAHSFNRMASGLEERERLREAFGAFVDPHVAERIMSDGALEGDEVEVSVLFLDIRDFTAFAEHSSAREVVTRLNHFYERVVPVLERHGGHANKFVGDGLLGVFGAPDRRSDHADRALSAALEIAGLVEQTYGDDLRIGIGINSGPVMAGTIGGGGRLDFTVIGDPVNTASRVEQMTRETGDTILVTEATRCLLEQGFELAERPAAELRGKTEPVRLWAPSEPDEVEEPRASGVLGQLRGRALDLARAGQKGSSGTS